MMLSKKLMKQAELAVGDEVEVRFRVVDQDAVDVPPELQEALDEQGHLGEIFAELSAGKRRGFAQRVSSAKMAPTRARRVAEILAELEALL